MPLPGMDAAASTAPFTCATETAAVLWVMISKHTVYVFIRESTQSRREAGLKLCEERLAPLIASVSRLVTRAELPKNYKPPPWRR